MKVGVLRLHVTTEISKATPAARTDAPPRMTLHVIVLALVGVTTAARFVECLLRPLSSLPLTLELLLQPIDPTIGKGLRVTVRAPERLAIVPPLTHQALRHPELDTADTAADRLDPLRKL